MTDGPTSLHPHTADELTELAGYVGSMRRNIEVFLELQRLVARMQRERYDALLQQGFSEDQALELAKQVRASNL